MTDTVPFVGRVVHYRVTIVEDEDTPDVQACRAAMVTELGGFDGHCSLHVIGPDYRSDLKGVPYDEEREPGTWHYLNARCSLEVLERGETPAPARHHGDLMPGAIT